MRIGGRHRAGQGTDMILSIPFVVALEEIFLYRIIVFDIIRLQKITYILDAHPDISQLHLQRHALLHSGFHRSVAIPSLVLRQIFHIFHHCVISEIISAFQQFHHTHNVASHAVLILFLVVILCFGCFGISYHLLIISRAWSKILRTCMAINLHRHRLAVEIRLRVERHHETVVNRRLLG